MLSVAEAFHYYIFISNNSRRKQKPRFLLSAPNLRKLSAHWKGIGATIRLCAPEGCAKGNLVSKNHEKLYSQNRMKFL